MRRRLWKALGATSGPKHLFETSSSGTTADIFLYWIVYSIVSSFKGVASPLKRRLAPSHEDMLKRGGREGPNVTNPTLTHDRPTKLFAFLGALHRCSRC